MNDYVRCYATDCPRDSTIVCRTCKNVNYCTVECQQLDLPIHIHLCNPSQTGRIRAMCHLLTTTLIDDEEECNLSYTIELAIPMANGEKRMHNIGAFGNRSCGEFYSTHINCVVCANRTIRRIDMERHVNFNGKQIPYYRCAECTQSRSIICDNSFLETTKCVTINKRFGTNAIRIILTKHHIRSYMSIPMDIMTVIIIQLIDLIPCKKCVLGRI